MSTTSPAPSTNHTPIVTLLTANTISQIGSMLTLVAVPWFVLVTTGSAAKTGLTGVFAALPFIIGGIFGGALVDHLGFKRTSVLADITSGITVALVPLLYHTVGLAFWELLALTFLSNLFNTPGSTARQSLVPELAEMAEMSLERANSLVQTVPRIATLFGPPLAGVLIAVSGASNVLWLDAATFAISAALIGAFVPNAAIARDAEEPRRYFADLTEGLRFIWHDRVLRTMSAVFALGNFLDAPISLLFALYAIRHYGNAVPVGLMFAALGAGAVIGSLWYGAVGHRVSRRAIFGLYCFPIAVMYATFALAPPLPVLLTVVFLDGIAVGPVNPLGATVTLERVPLALRGRVQGMRTAISFMTIPLGRGVAGLVVDAVGLQAIFFAIAGSFLLIAIGISIAPAFRDLRAPVDRDAYCRAAVPQRTASSP